MKAGLPEDTAGECAPPHPVGAINRAPTQSASLRSPTLDTSPAVSLQVLFCRTCWINPHSTDKGEEGVVRGHLALRQRAAALCTPACCRTCWINPHSTGGEGGGGGARTPRAPAKGGRPLHSCLVATFRSPWIVDTKLESLPICMLRLLYGT